MNEKSESATSYFIGGTGGTVALHDGGVSGLLHIQDITDVVNLVLAVLSLILVCYRLYRDISK